MVLSRLAENIGRNLGINLDLKDLRKAGATKLKYEVVYAMQKTFCYNAWWYFSQAKRELLGNVFPYRTLCVKWLLCYLLFTFMFEQYFFTPQKTPPPHQAWHFGNVPVPVTCDILADFFLPSLSAVNV